MNRIIKIKKEERKKARGITLIALVITIVILIILSTVTINMAFGDRGLIQQAELAKDMTANSTVAESEGINSLMEEYANIMAEDEEIEEPEIYDTVEDVLTEGDYVNYVDGTGATRTCVVLYGPENENYSSYGIQIITMETVEEVELGNGTGSIQENNTTYFEKAKNSYNNAISTLHTKAQAYLNTTYASGARSAGSVPNNTTYDGAEMYTREDSWFADYNGIFKDTDNNYLTDWNQMNTLSIRNIDENYWLVSRYVTYDSSGSSFRVRDVDTSGSLNRSDLCSVHSSGTAYSNSYTYGLRVVFTLKPDIKVTGGNGEKGSPYNLGI